MFQISNYWFPQEKEKGSLSLPAPLPSSRSYNAVFFLMFFADIYVNLSRKPKDTSLQMSVYLFVRGEGYVLGLRSNQAANCQFGRNKSKCHCTTPAVYNVSRYRATLNRQTHSDMMLTCPGRVWTVFCTGHITRWSCCAVWLWYLNHSVEFW